MYFAGQASGLVYPNLATASIRAAPPGAGGTSRPRQPPGGPSSILGRVTRLPAYAGPSPERYGFEVERRVLGAKRGRPSASAIDGGGNSAGPGRTTVGG